MCAEVLWLHYSSRKLSCKETERKHGSLHFQPPGYLSSMKSWLLHGSLNRWMMFVQKSECWKKIMLLSLKTFKWHKPRDVIESSHEKKSITTFFFQSRKSISKLNFRMTSYFVRPSIWTYSKKTGYFSATVENMVKGIKNMTTKTSYTWCIRITRM